MVDSSCLGKKIVMKQLIHLCWRSWGYVLTLTLLLLLVCPVSLAQSVQDLPNPRQQNGSWISDRADLLSPAMEGQLNQRINQLNARTTAELAIATLPQIESTNDSRAFTLELFNHWKIGKRFKNNGVLLLIAKNNRRVEVMTGSGLQDTLPDAEVSQLIQQQMLPAFQQADYETGIHQGTLAIAQKLESRLPKTWLPLPVAGILAILGILVAAIGYGGVARFLQTAPQMKIPAQGFEGEKFRNAMSSLANASFPNLLAELFNQDANREQSPPKWMQGCLCGGGTLLGLAIALASQTILIPNPGWASGYMIVLGGVLNSFAGLCAILLPALLLLINKRDELIPILLIPLCFAIFGSAYIVGQVPAWPWIIGTIIVVNLLNSGFWWLISDSVLVFKRQWIYRSDRSNNPIQELNPDELTSLLSPSERLAQSMGNLAFRGWRDAGLPVPLTKDQVYLVQARDAMAIACSQCQSLTIDQSTQTIEKTVQSRKKVKGKKQKQLVDSVIQVSQTTYTCRFCGYDWVQEAVIRANDDRVSDTGSESYYSSSDYSINNSSSTDDDYYRNNYQNDTYGNTSSSDFGGGSSDGGGTGDSW